MISFGKWSHAASKYFLMDRIYFKGYKWTPFIKMKFRKKPTLDNMHDVMRVQGYDGNWNYDPYMHGMYNGMELMLSIAESREPVFRGAPDKWLRDNPREHIVTSSPIETQCNGVLN